MGLISLLSVETINFEFGGTVSELVNRGAGAYPYECASADKYPNNCVFYSKENGTWIPEQNLQILPNGNYTYEWVTVDDIKYYSSLARSARLIASGTMATLTGFSRYDEIEPIQAEFVEFCEENEKVFATWQTAWDAYAKLKGF